MLFLPPAPPPIYLHLSYRHTSTVPRRPLDASTNTDRSRLPHRRLVSLAGRSSVAAIGQKERGSEERRGQGIRTAQSEVPSPLVLVQLLARFSTHLSLAKVCTSLSACHSNAIVVNLRCSSSDIPDIVSKSRSDSSSKLCFVMHRRNAPHAAKKGVDPPEDDPPTYDSALLPLRESRSNEGGNISRRIKNFLLGPCHDFLHARTGPQGCRLAGIMRVCYASLYLYSVSLMTLQMSTLFDPRKGLVPYAITSEDLDDTAYSIFRYFPDSSLAVHALFLLGMTSGVLLFLGVEPRWGVGGCYVFLHNMQNHNTYLWDNEFHMNRLWALFFIFLPLDHITIYDGFGGLYPLIRERLNLPQINLPKRQQQQQKALNLSSSWPMWPFRLWQVYICLVYVGAAFGKYTSSAWIRGDALSWCWYDEGRGRHYPEFINEILFNRLLPVKLQTWLSLVVEMLSFVTIWPLKTRKITFIAIVLLHIGIELALLMHIFEYLSVLGWVSFFAFPNDGKSEPVTLVENKKINKTTKPSGATPVWTQKKIIETTFAVSMLYLFTLDTWPGRYANKVLPSALAYPLYVLVHPSRYLRRKLGTLMDITGLSTGPYTLFKGIPPHAQARMTAVIRFNDGKDPMLYREKDWADSGYLETEINYWYDTYMYYLLKEDPNDEEIPYYATFAVHLAEKYGGGKIKREYNDINIDRGNTVESISVLVHHRYGSDDPPPRDLGGFEPIPRKWTYASQCHYVFNPHRLQLEGQKHTLDMNSLWDYDEHDRLSVKNGCVSINPDDFDIHSEGQYGDPTAESSEDEPRSADLPVRDRPPRPPGRRETRGEDRPRPHRKARRSNNRQRDRGNRQDFDPRAGARALARRSEGERGGRRDHGGGRDEHRGRGSRGHKDRRGF
ncbi:hypothetical protein ACHAWF_006849 [Thalassiosira exigua]